MTPSVGRIVLPPALRATLAAEAGRARPEECCGALLGKCAGDVRRIHAALRLPNAALAGRYEIGPADVGQAEASAREHGLEIVGFYHSHPRQPAAPSALDLEAAWPWYAYVIVDALQGTARAWRLADDRSAFLPLAVEDE